MNTVVVRYVHPVRTKQYTKKRTQNTQWKQGYRWKRYRSMTRRNVRHFPLPIGWMTPKSVCLWHHQEHGDSNKRWRKRRNQPSPERLLRRLKMAMCRLNWLHNDLTVRRKLQVLSKTASRLWLNAYKKYKNGNYARRTSSHRHIRPPICYGGSDNFSSGISGKLPKIATSNVIFTRTADRIAAKFYMTI